MISFGFLILILSFSRTFGSFELPSLGNGLVAYYPFDENEGDDLSGNGNNGQTFLLASAPDRLGRKDRCFWFSGAGSYFEVANGNSFNFVNDMSIAMWIRSLNEKSHYILSKSDYKGENQFRSGGFSLHSDSTLGSTFTLTHGLNVSMDSQIFILPNQGWFHLAIVKNDDTSVVYVNGVEISRTVFRFQSIFPNGNLPLIIGSTNRGQTNPASNLDLFFKGYLDEIYFYNRSLTLAEISFLAVNNSATTTKSTNPTVVPSINPTFNPSFNPTVAPSTSPTIVPSAIPSVEPSPAPTVVPSTIPSEIPTAAPSTRSPTRAPTKFPTLQPSRSPYSTNPDDVKSLIEIYRVLNGKYWNFPIGKQWNTSTDPCADGWYGIVCQVDLRKSRTSQFFYVLEVRLNSMNLRGSITSDMLRFYSLGTLSLANNQLVGSLPDLSTFPPIGIMNLSNNEFTGAMPLLTSLNTLDVTHNFFDSIGYPIDTSGKNPNFRTQYLYLSNNLLTKTPVFQLINFPYLSTIDLSYNKLSDDSELVRIPSFLDKTPIDLMLTIKFTGNLFRQIPSFLNFYANNVQILDFRRNQISNCSYFPASISFTLLTDLFLSENRIQSCAFTAENLPSLAVLDLSNNLLSSFPKFTAPTTSLTVLLLGNNQISSYSSSISSYSTGAHHSHDIHSLTTDLSFFSNLKSLSLKNNSLTTLPTFINDQDTQFLPLLESLDLSANSVQGTIPSILGNCEKNRSTLQSLNLQNNQLQGSLPSFTYCKSLRFLDVRWNALNGEIPSFDYTPHISHLLLSHNKFQGTIPIFGKIRNLTTLSLSYNSFTGLQATSFSNLKNLSSLEIGYNPFKSFPPYLDLPQSLDHFGLRRRDAPVALSFSLAGVGLTEIPSFLYNTSLLITSLDLSDNRFHDCTSLFNLSVILTDLLSLDLKKNAFQRCFINTDNVPSLTSLDISDNQLTRLPFIDGTEALWDLITFSCANNNINEFPSFLSNIMPNVAFLDMSHNELQGNIPANFTYLTNLTFIDLSFNALTGTVPSLDYLTRLIHLSVADNQLTGPFPTLSVDKLQILQLQNNRFNATIPLNTISKMTSLRQFSIQNNHFYNDALDRSSLLETLSHLPQLQFVNVSFNEFQETIPATFFQGTPFQYLDLRNNFFYGSLPKIVSSKLFYLNLENNMLSGMLSEESVPRRLTGFYINDNYFSGQLPSNFLTNFGLLSSFQLSNNHFSGNLVDVFRPQSQGAAAVSVAAAPHASQAPAKTYPNVIYFSVKGNSFEGNLETLLSLFPNLRVLEVSANGFTGELKDALKVMKSLMYVDVSGNDLSGDIGTLFDPLQQSSLTFIDLSDNRFSGRLSEEFFLGVSKSLQLFSATKNCIGGSIPEEICEAKHLKSLRLDGLGSASTCRVNLLPTDIGKSESSNNKESYRLKHPVEGSLPICLLENLPELQSLYISGNGLSGSFPHNISLSSSSSRLREFVFSYNRLTGSIPSALQSYRHWKIFDGSFNKLNGVLDGSNGFCRVKNVLQLNGNRLSGDIPSCLLSPTTSTNTDRIIGPVDDDYYYSDTVALLSTLPQNNNNSNNDTSQQKTPSGHSSNLRLNILEGNLFGCQSSPGTRIRKSSSSLKSHHRTELPHSDPFNEQYICGSQAVDDSLISWTVLLCFVLLILLLDYSWHLYIRPFFSSLSFFSSTREGKINESNSQSNRTSSAVDEPLEKSERNRQIKAKPVKPSRFEIMKEFYELCSIWLEEGNPFALKIQEKNQEFFQRYLISSINPSTGKKIISTASSNSIPELLKTLYYLRWFSIGILTFIFLVLLPIYGGFYPFRTHSFSYIWSISIGYLSGIFPSLFLLGIFWLFYVLLISCFHALVTIVAQSRTKNNNQNEENNLAEDQHDQEHVNSTDFDSRNETILQSSSNNSPNFLLSCWNCCKWLCCIDYLQRIPWISLFAYFMVFVINIIVIFGASIGYVRLLNSNISAGARIGLQIAMAILKIVWSFFFIKRIFLACLKNFDLLEEEKHLEEEEDNDNEPSPHISTLPNYLSIVSYRSIIGSTRSIFGGSIMNEKNSPNEIFTENAAMSSKKLIFLSFLVILNFVIAPIFAVAIFDANCFKYVFFPSTTISSHQEVTIENLFCSKVIVSYNFMGFTQINENTFCNSETITNEIDFNPPYLYSYQCTSTLLSEFVAIYVYQYCFSLCLFLLGIGILLLLEKYHIYSEILTTIFLPKPLYFSILVYRRENSLYNPIENIELFFKPYLPKYFFIDWEEMNYLAGVNDTNVNDKNHHIIMNSRSNSSQREKNQRKDIILMKKMTNSVYSALSHPFPHGSYYNKCFDGDVVVIGFMGDLILLLTFGMAFPLLAILCTISIILKTKYQQLIIGRLIYELKATILQEDCKEINENDDEKILEEMTKRIVDLLPLPPNTTTMMNYNRSRSFDLEAVDLYELTPSSLLGQRLDSYSHLEQTEGTNISQFPSSFYRTDSNLHQNKLHNHSNRSLLSSSSATKADRWLDPEEYLKTFCYESHFFLHYFISMGKYLLNFSAIFFSFFLFDMLGDVLGINRSIWIIPICSILPFLAWITYHWIVWLLSCCCCCERNSNENEDHEHQEQPQQPASSSSPDRGEERAGEEDLENVSSSKKELIPHHPNHSSPAGDNSKDLSFYSTLRMEVENNHHEPSHEFDGAEESSAAFLPPLSPTVSNRSLSGFSLLTKTDSQRYVEEMAKELRIREKELLEERQERQQQQRDENQKEEADEASSSSNKVPSLVNLRAFGSQRSHEKLISDTTDSPISSRKSSPRPKE